MKIRTKIVVIMALAVMDGLILPCTTGVAVASTVSSPVAIDGVVYDKLHNPVPNLTVVAWCGGVNFFGGAGKTDSNGHYIINTDSDACPFDNELTVTTDIDNDGLNDGSRYTQVHTQTTINIYLGDYTSVVIPEYSLIGASAATLAGIGTIGFIRRKQLKIDSQAAF